MAITLGGGGSASVINEKKEFNSAENLMTLADGRVYLKGGVSSTDLSTYPDATAALAYTGTSFSDSAQVNQPAGITWDGSFFWVVDRGSTNSVFKYNALGVYQNVSFSVGNQGTNPTDIVWDGSFFWVINNAASPYKRVSKYNASGVYQNVFWEYNSVTTMEGQGLAWDGTFFYVIGNSTDTIRKFNAAGVDQGVSYSVAAQETDPKGITFDGTYLWVIGASSYKAHKFNTSGVYQNESFSVSTQETNPEGIVWVSPAFYVAGNSTQKVYKYQNQIGVTTNGSASQIANGRQNYVRIK